MKIPIDNDWRYVNGFVRYADEKFGTEVSDALQEKANELAGEAHHESNRTWRCPRCGHARRHSEAAAIVRYKKPDTELDILKSNTICSECHDEFLDWLDGEE